MDTKIISEKLVQIRDLANEIREAFMNSSNLRAPEIRSMTRAILDRVLQLEYEVLRLEE
jgi:hypothetical protein